MIWKTIHSLSNDPHPEVAKMAEAIIDEVRTRLQVTNNNADGSHSGSPCNGSKMDLSTEVNNRSHLPPHMTTPHRQHTVSEGPSSDRVHTCLSTPTSSGSITSRRKTTSNSNVNGGGNNLQESQGDNDSTTSSTTRGQSIVSTHFVSWCVKQFVSQSCRLEAWDPESSDHQKRELALGQQIRVSELAKEELSRVDPMAFEDQIFLQKQQNKPRFMQIHSFEPLLFVAERDSFTVWSWEGLKPQEKPCPPTSLPMPYILVHSKNRVTLPSTSSITANQPSFPSVSSTITGMELLNVTDMSTLLALASDDGSVRIWSLDKRICEADILTNRIKPKMMSAFHLFKETNSSSQQDKTLMNAFASSSRDSSITPFKTVFYWDQETYTFIAGSSSSRFIKLWDANQEKTQRIIRLESDGINTITCDGEDTICTGFMDGTVRILDRRDPSTGEKPRVFREHDAPIVSAHLVLQEVSSHMFVLSAAANGEVKFWDKRLTHSIKTMAMGQELSTLVVHPEADVFAW